MRLRYNSIVGTRVVKLNLLLLALLYVLAIFIVQPVSKSKALSGSEFQAGNIISDGIFFNGHDMSLANIQAFLDSKVPVCDTDGTQSYAGTTRAAYGASRGYPAPYTCLKDYREDTPQRLAEDQLCTGLGAGNKSAAQIIYEVGISCGVNPKVLIVLLQKEQSLITDDWPWSIQYRSATGYGCPDTAPCDTEYYGFFNQVYNAARQFKRYAKYPDDYNYAGNTTSYILYNPNTNCGGSMVQVLNQATAGLYNYTPYQPNQSALNNLYGSGDECGAYGNRNFWRMYNEWFGSTQLAATCAGTETQSSVVRRFYNHRTFQHFYSALDCDVAFLEKLGFVNEGAVFNTTDSTWGQPVYRLYNPTTKLHFWTTHYETEAELIAGGSGYRQEAGIVFYVLPGSMTETTNKVEKFYNPNTYLHFWVANPSQQDKDFIYTHAGYLYEGPVFATQ
jgi:hypothetical protein